jgi:hypothetical protein
LLGENCAPVIKTHDVYRGDLNCDIKYVFLFSDPLESAKSVDKMGEKYGASWIAKHISHLNGKGNPRDIYHADVLNYEEQIKSWSEASDTLVIHYEDLWVVGYKLEQFLGFHVQLPERTTRVSKDSPSCYNRALFKRLKRVESGLKERCK